MLVIRVHPLPCFMMLELDLAKNFSLPAVPILDLVSKGIC